MTRILILMDVFSFSPAGGAGTVMWETARELVGRGHEVHVVCRRRADIPLDGEIEGVWFHTYDAREGRRASMYWKGRKGFRQAWDRHQRSVAGGKPHDGRVDMGGGARGQQPASEHCAPGLLKSGVGFDVVIAHHAFPLRVLRNRIEKARIPVIYMFHSPWPREFVTRRRPGRLGVGGRFMRFLRGRIERAGLEMSQRVIVLSEYMKGVAKDMYGIPEEKFRLIPGGANVARFTPVSEKTEVRKELGLPTDRRIVVTVRGLVPRMGLENLVDAMPRLIREIPDILLLIGGTGALREELADRLFYRGVEEHARMLGFVPNELLAEYYRAADLFVLPTRELEGFGLVTVEALACGTPVVGTAIGGTTEILSRLDRRLLLRESSPQEIADGIIGFFRTPELQALAGQRCRNFVLENYTWERAADRLEKVIHEVMGDRPLGPADPKEDLGY